MRLGERALRHLDERLCRMLRNRVPKGVGFALILFNFGDGPDQFITWGSNGRRPDMVKAMRELLAHILEEQN